MPTTYDELIRQVPIWGYNQNRDLVDEMPAIVAQAEDQIFNLIDHDLFQTVITGQTLTTGNPDLDLTGLGIMEIRAIRLSYRGAYSFTALERRDLEMLSMLYTTNRPARPRFYAEYEDIDKVRVFPIPREDYDLEITANVEPPRLTVANQTNKLAEKYPRVYEKACLRQAALFMKNQQDAATYEGEMMSALQEASLAIARKRRDETGTRPVETSNASGT